MKTNTRFFNRISFSSSLKGKMFQTQGVHKIRTHILCSVSVFFFFKEVVPFVRYNVDKYRRATQATDDNMAQTHCMLDTKGYKYTRSKVV